MQTQQMQTQQTQQMQTQPVQPSHDISLTEFLQNKESSESSCANSYKSEFNKSADAYKKYGFKDSTLDEIYDDTHDDGYDGYDSMYDSANDIYDNDAAWRSK